MKKRISWKESLQEGIEWFVTGLVTIIVVISLIVSGLLITGNIHTVEYITDTEYITTQETVYKDTDTDKFGEAYLEAVLEEYVDVFDEADYFNQFDIDMINDYEFHRRFAEVITWYETLEELDSDLYTDDELVHYADMLKLRINSFAVYVDQMRQDMAKPSYTQEEVENIIEEFIELAIELDENPDDYKIEYDNDTQIMSLYELDDLGNEWILIESFTMEYMIELTK